MTPAVRLGRCPVKDRPSSSNFIVLPHSSPGRLDVDRQVIIEHMILSTHNSFRAALKRYYTMVSHLSSKETKAIQTAEDTEKIYRNQIPIFVQCLSSFAKGIPQFGDISVEDQRVLIKGSILEASVIYDSTHVHITDLFWQDDKLQFRLNWHQVDRLGLLGKVYSQMRPIIAKLRRLELTDVELSLLCALVVFCPDREGLTTTRLLENLETDIAMALKCQLLLNHGEASLLLARIVEVVVDLRGLSAQFMDRIYNARVDSTSNATSIDAMLSTHGPLVDLIESRDSSPSPFLAGSYTAGSHEPSDINGEMEIEQFEMNPINTRELIMEDGINNCGTDLSSCTFSSNTTAAMTWKSRGCSAYDSDTVGNHSLLETVERPDSDTAVSCHVVSTGSGSTGIPGRIGGEEERSHHANFTLPSQDFPMNSQRPASTLEVPKEQHKHRSHHANFTLPSQDFPMNSHHPASTPEVPKEQHTHRSHHANFTLPSQDFPMNSHHPASTPEVSKEQTAACGHMTPYMSPFHKYKEAAPEDITARTDMPASQTDRLPQAPMLKKKASKRRSAHNGRRDPACSSTQVPPVSAYVPSAPPVSELHSSFLNSGQFSVNQQPSGRHFTYQQTDNSNAYAGSASALFPQLSSVLSRRNATSVTKNKLTPPLTQGQPRLQSACLPPSHPRIPTGHHMNPARSQQEASASGVAAGSEVCDFQPGMATQPHQLMSAPSVSSTHSSSLFIGTATETRWAHQMPVDSTSVQTQTMLASRPDNLQDGLPSSRGTPLTAPPPLILANGETPTTPHGQHMLTGPAQWNVNVHPSSNVYTSQQMSTTLEGDDSDHFRPPPLMTLQGHLIFDNGSASAPSRPHQGQKFQRLWSGLDASNVHCHNLS